MECRDKLSPSNIGFTGTCVYHDHQKYSLDVNLEFIAIIFLRLSILYR